MDKKKRTYIMIAIVVIALAAAVAGYLILPDTLVTQISLSGENATTMPKALALAIPLILAAGGAVLYRGGGEKKYLLVSLVGLVINIFAFAVNL